MVERIKDVFREERNWRTGKQLPRGETAGEQRRRERKETRARYVVTDAMQVVPPTARGILPQNYIPMDDVFAALEADACGDKPKGEQP